MRPALDVIWETLRDWYNGMVGLAAVNFVWLAVSLTVILLPPATAGLYAVAHSIAGGTGAHWPDFVAGARRYAGLSYQWALLNAAVGLVFVVNYAFYGAADSALGIVIQLALVLLGALWLTVQFYVWPFLLIQKQKRLSVALKNALFLTLANPLYTLLLIGFAVFTLAVSLITILPLAVFASTFIALLGSRAVRERLQTYEKLSHSPSSGEETS